MKIGIVSDTHDNWNNFKKAIEWFNKEEIKTVLHCGDIFSQETIDNVDKIFSGEIKYVKGNADYSLENIPEKLDIELGNKKIGFAHFPDVVKKMAQSQDYDTVFYGHTHRPWDEKIGNCHMINPGELAGHFYKPTFAVYDTDNGKLELKILETL